VAASLTRLFAQQAQQYFASSRYSRYQPSTGGGSKSALKVEAEASTRTLIISASPADWPLVKQILDKLGIQEVEDRPPTTRQIVLKHAKAEEVAQTLREIYTGASTSRQSPQYSRYSRGRYTPPTSGGAIRATSPTGSPILITAIARINALLISASDEDHQAIDALIEKLDVPEAETIEPIRMVRLQAADAVKLAAKLRQMVPTAPGAAPDVYIDADAATNSLLLRAPESKRQMLDKIIAELDEAHLADARETRIVELKYASASAVASTVSALVAGRSSPQASSYSRYRRSYSAPVSTGGDAAIVTAAPNDKAVIIDAPRRKIEKIAALVASLDQPATVDQLEVRIYQLEHSSAAEVAQKLARLFLASARGRSEPAGAPAARFEADSATNQLLIAATPEQFEKIEAAIQKITSSTLVVHRTRTFLLKHAKAAELMGVLQSILAGQSPASAYSSAYRGRGYRAPAATGGASAGIRMAVMPSANAIVVQANPAKLEQVAALIADFDKEEVVGRSIIKIIELTNAKAETVAATLARMIPPVGRGQEATIYIEADKLTNSILLRGPASEREMLEKMVASR